MNQKKIIKTKIEEVFIKGKLEESSIFKYDENGRIVYSKQSENEVHYEYDDKGNEIHFKDSDRY